MSSVRIGAVLIGRNEGDRLVRCLASIQCGVSTIVYVDSGSTDDSVVLARRAGAEVVELDMSLPFTAARARNAGLAALLADGTFDYVQFIDGDCQLQDGWITTAKVFLDSTPVAAVAAGRRRERFPQASIYNAICDREWNTPVGQAKACGGDALIRVAPFLQVGGFNPSLIAGEEPELCVRLRHAGWEVWRLDAEMTLHDAAINRFGQWWKRSRRGGYAAAEGAAMHGGAPEYHGVVATVRALAWGAALPMLILILMILVTPWSIILISAYVLQIFRLVCKDSIVNWESWKHAFFLMLVKFPETQGILEYGFSYLKKDQKFIIEYK